MFLATAGGKRGGSREYPHEDPGAPGRLREIGNHRATRPLGDGSGGSAGLTRATLSTLLNEHSQLSSEMALRIEKAFGVSMDTLMRMQNSYDISQARKREG
jgi:hypothetical protein